MEEKRKQKKKKKICLITISNEFQFKWILSPQYSTIIIDESMIDMQEYESLICKIFRESSFNLIFEQRLHFSSTYKYINIQIY